MASDAFVLHRYFLSASEMRAQFVALVAKEGPARFQSPQFLRQFIYWSLWYSTLQVVVEGWEALGFEDVRVDELLADTRMRSLLRRYRNGVVHFQRIEWDDGTAAR